MTGLPWNRTSASTGESTALAELFGYGIAFLKVRKVLGSGPVLIRTSGWNSQPTVQTAPHRLVKIPLGV
mgnify:CR=1 FL=1